MKTAFLRLTTIAALLLSAHATHAAGDRQGIYLSGLFGVVVADDWRRVVGNIEGILGTTATRSDRYALGGSVALGYRLSRHTAVELNYIHGGETSIEFATLPVTFQARKKLAGLSWLGILPVTESLELHGKIGAAHWKLDSEYVSGGTVLLSDRISGNDLTLGGGLAYSLTRQLDIIGDYTRIKMKVTGGHLSVDHYLYGLRYRF